MAAVSLRTPNIDAIAAAATRFDHTYCHAPVCVPARGSILTGLYPHQHGARILDDPLPDHIPTVAQVFKERGYATGADRETTQPQMSSDVL